MTGIQLWSLGLGAALLCPAALTLLALAAGPHRRLQSELRAVQAGNRTSRDAQERVYQAIRGYHA